MVTLSAGRQAGNEACPMRVGSQTSNRGKPTKLRRRVLILIKKNYSGLEEERFGPTLAAEHLADEDGIVVDHETSRRFMLVGAPLVSAESEETLPTKGAQGALWQAGAAG